jgi:hypothetical protein
MKTLQNYIADEEFNSEKIASIVQVSLILLLLLVYTISPKGFASTSNQSFEPVKIMALTYLPILLIRLFWNVNGLGVFISYSVSR